MNDWHEIPADKMTEEQLRQAVKDLRKAWIHAEVHTTCKYMLPCGMCEKYGKMCNDFTDIANKGNIGYNFQQEDGSDG